VNKIREKAQLLTDIGVFLEGILPLKVREELLFS